MGDAAQAMMVEFAASDPIPGVQLILTYVDPRCISFDVYVDLAFRRRGLAKLALKQLNDWADEYGVAIYIRVNPHGPRRMTVKRLKRFYTDMGFEPWGKARMYVRPGGRDQYRPRRIWKDPS